MNRTIKQVGIALTEDEARDAVIRISIGDDEFITIVAYEDDDPESEDFGSLVYRITDEINPYGPAVHEGAVEDYFYCGHVYDSYCAKCGIDS